MKSVLVTGCSGFIGRNLVSALTSRGFEVIGVDRERPVDGSGLAEFLELDLSADSSVSELQDLMSKVDAVCHLAAARTDWGLSYWEYRRDNYEVTRAVVDAAVLSNVRVWLYFGTVGVYGPSAESVDENAEFDPDTDYGLTKAEAERYLLAVAGGHGWAVRVIRPSAVFSEGQPPDTNLYRLIEAIRKNRFMLIGDGSKIKTTSYLHNVVDASLWLLDDLADGGVEVFNYIDEPRLTTREMIDLIRGDLGMRLPLVRLPLGAVERPARVLDWLADRVGRDLPITAARIRKFCTATNFDAWKIRRAGFEPRYSSYDALRRTVKWHAGADVADDRKVSE